MKLMLIGGGNIGKSDTKYETGNMDKEIVKMTNKENPNMLFIGLASSFSDSYYKVLKDVYKNLGCITGKVSTKTLKNYDVVKNKFNEADIIYIGAGDTKRLIDIVYEYNLKPLFDSAIKDNKVIAGISAGAISICKYGLSDTLIMNNISDKYSKIDGLGYLDYMFVPHYSSDPNKEKDLKEELKNTNIKALCTDDLCALKIVDNKISIIKGDISAKAYEVTNKDKFIKKEIIC